MILAIGGGPRAGESTLGEQIAMAKGCDTVLAEIWPELARRGVAVEHA